MWFNKKNVWSVDNGLYEVRNKNVTCSSNRNLGTQKENADKWENNKKYYQKIETRGYLGTKCNTCGNIFLL